MNIFEFFHDETNVMSRSYISKKRISTGNGRMFLVGELRVARRVFLNRAAIVVRAAAIFHCRSLCTSSRYTQSPLDTTTLNRSVRVLPLFEKRRGNADTRRR